MMMIYRTQGPVKMSAVIPFSMCRDPQGSLVKMSEALEVQILNCFGASFLGLLVWLFNGAACTTTGQAPQKRKLADDERADGNGGTFTRESERRCRR
jgi:hypothetical protein